MTPFRVGLLCCALTVALASAGSARAGEVEATLACHSRCSNSRACAKPCYDPCEPTGPVRRFLRRVFLPTCPPRCPAPSAVVVVPPAPQPFVPPANLGRPVPPPSASPFPSATSNRPQHLTPPTPPQPVRLDYLASRNGR